MSVISVRVDSRLRESLEKAGINVSKEVKQFLEDLAWKVELKQRLKRLNKSLQKVPSAHKGFAAKSVREDREGG